MIVAAVMQVIVEEVVKVLIFDRTMLLTAAAAYLLGFKAVPAAAATYTFSFILVPEDRFVDSGVPRFIDSSMTRLVNSCVS